MSELEMRQQQQITRIFERLYALENQGRKFHKKLKNQKEIISELKEKIKLNEN